MDATLPLTLALMGVVGFALGIFGGGGSILAVPVLVYVARVSPAVAVGTSLAIVGATSVTAMYSHQRRGHVHARMGLIFGGAGTVTAFLGAKLAHLVSERVLMLAFAGLMVVVGGWMLLDRRTPEPSEISPAKPRVVRAVFAGAAVGAVTGFLGVGGGFLIVPALIAFARLDMRAAVGTSLLVIAVNSAAGFVGHLDANHLDFGLIAVMTVAGILGALVGARQAMRFPVERLRRGFALFVIVVGVGVAVSTALAEAATMHPHGP